MNSWTNRTACKRFTALAFVLVAVLLVGLLAMQASTTPAFADQANSSTTAKQTVKKGWVTFKSGVKKYYVKGEAVTGAKKIGGKWRAFNAKGKLMKKTFKLAGVTYYASTKGVLEARKAKGSYYYANGKKMTKTDAYEYKTVLKARVIVKKITKPAQSKYTKLRVCFNWVRAKNYAFHREWTGSKTWPAVYAMDHFNNKNGDCHSDAAAFAYLAYAIGYTNVYCCTDSGKTKEDNHAWCELNGKVYDPLFDQSKSGSYFGRSYSNFMTNAPATKVKIPYYSAKHASKNAKKLSSKNGLIKSGSSYCYYNNGVKLRNVWKTVNGKRYYFMKNGKAARFACKVKGTWYVFGTDGVLQKGSKTRFVAVGKRTYRVTPGGKAVKGWNSDKTMYCDKTGRLLCGIWLVKGKLYAASSAGIYDATKTAALRAASAKMTTSGNPVEAQALLDLLGAPIKSTYMGSCNTVKDAEGKKHAGKDGILEYKHIKVMTFLDDDSNCASKGREWLVGIEAA